MAEVPVNGRVLQWARQIRGLDINDAATLLGISSTELRAYENENKRPLVGFLRLMSAKYQINFSSLLMPEPLPIRKRPVDHRKRNRRQRLTIDTLVAIEEVTQALDTFQDISGARARIIPPLNIGMADLGDDPEDVAARERKRLGVTLQEQWAWNGLAHARRQWRRRVESRGVFTYMIPMPLDELSGFSILRGKVAAICINDKEPTEGAKIFTLFHEYAHLLLRQTGISDENNENAVERFCNDFAASFLIPRSALSVMVSDVKTPYEFSASDVKRLATRFRVSNRAIALRLEKTGLAPKGFYARRTAPWDLPTERVQQTGDAQPSYVTLRIKRIGRLHATTVLQAFKRRAINSADAAELIGIQLSSFPKVEAALG